MPPKKQHFLPGNVHREGRSRSKLPAANVSKGYARSKAQQNKESNGELFYALIVQIIFVCHRLDLFISLIGYVNLLKPCAFCDQMLRCLPGEVTQRTETTDRESRGQKKHPLPSIPTYRKGDISVTGHSLHQ